jgi:hypothetical protein
MKKKVAPIAPGTWFAVPLRTGAFAPGIVARVGSGGVLLGYFFGPAVSEIPALNALQGLKASNAVLVRRFGDLGMIRGKWPVLGVSPDWKAADWPLPDFVRFETDASRAWLVKYAEDDVNKYMNETPCPALEVEGHPLDALSGYGAIELILTKRLSEGDTSRPPERAAGQASPRPDASPTMIRFFLYFSDESRAGQVAKELLAQDYRAHVKLSTDNENWLVLATASATQAERTAPVDARERLMEELASRYEGEYDGWEIDSPPAASAES